MPISLALPDAAETMRILDEIQAGVQESYADVRELLVHFRTRIAEGDVEHGIRTLLARLEHQTGVRTELRVAGKVDPLFVEVVAELAPAITEQVRGGDVVIAMGAGSIGTVAQQVTELLGAAKEGSK